MGNLSVDDIPAGVAVVDEGGRVVEANRAFREWCGAGEVIGLALAELIAPARDFLAGTDPSMVLSRRAVGRVGLLTRQGTGRGELVVVLEATSRYEAGSTLRTRMQLADRTQRRLQLVIDAATAFAEARTEQRLADVLAATTARAYAAEESVVYLADPTGELVRAAGHDALGAFVEAAVWSRNGVVKVAGTAAGDALAPGLGEAMRAAGVQSLIAAPLLHDDIDFGSFGCFFRHPREFDDEAAPLAAALANQAAQTLTALRLQQRLQHAAMHDEATGLPNRRLLEEKTALLASTRRTAVLFLDLDGFKQINDTFGHQLGDDVLREVARRLLAAVRDEDVVARYGGDEFIVVCDDADETVAIDVAQRLRAEIQAPYPFLPATVSLGASIGIAVGAARDEAPTIDRLVRAADQAMYRAKAEGGDRVQLAWR
jgi:diguanylate cyclase (GGDEF)-like protein